MRTLFADTHYYLAAMNPRDEWHDAAVRFSRDESFRLVTSEFVLLEVADGLSSTPSRGLFKTLFDSTRGDPRTRVVRLSSRILSSAIAIYSHRGDKAWSLTDCTSFEIMHRWGIQHVLTADHHFVQAGFQALLA